MVAPVLWRYVKIIAFICHVFILRCHCVDLDLFIWYERIGRVFILGVRWSRAAMDMEYREAPSQESPTSTEDYTQEQKPVLGRRRRCHLYNSSSSWSWCDLIRNIFYSLLWILCLCSSAYSLWRVQILESELQQLREFLRISPSQVSILHITPLQLFQHENYIQ